MNRGLGRHRGGSFRLNAPKTAEDERLGVLATNWMASVYSLGGLWLLLLLPYGWRKGRRPTLFEANLANTWAWMAGGRLWPDRCANAKRPRTALRHCAAWSLGHPASQSMGWTVASCCHHWDRTSTASCRLCCHCPGVWARYRDEYVNLSDRLEAKHHLSLRCLKLSF